jgi:hypothetical protein
MKIRNLVTVVPLVSALTIGTAFAQGNPHLDTIESRQQLASIQGNPQIGFVVRGATIARYQGNPHEGYISKVVLVADNRGNPQAGFRLVPLTIASVE